MIPSLVSGSATTAEDANTLMCVARASSSPPPSAEPETAAMEGMGRAARAARVERSVVRKWAVWAGVKVRRCLRSAPAQKVEGEVEARMRARVVVVVGEVVAVVREVISWERRERREVLRALWAEGRLRERILMWPVCGAGMVWVRSSGSGSGFGGLKEVRRVRR